VRDVVDKPTHQVLDAVRAGQLGVDRWVAECLERAAARAPLGAFISLQREAALARARELQARFDPAAMPSLCGMPFAVKDNIDVAGVPTTLGTKALGGRPAAVDAEAVARLRSAGAVPIGKTNLHELGFGFTGENSAFGTARNPHASDRIAGGSSSGSAVCVAAGVVPAALGTDTSGSLRVPAALCGVVGFRPTHGRYPVAGVAPISPTRDTLGVIARSPEEVLLLDEVLSGDAAAQPPVALEGLHLGVPREYFYQDLESEVEGAVEAELARLSDLGVVLVEVDLPGVARWSARCRPIIEREISDHFEAHLEQAGHSASLRELLLGSASPRIRALIDAPFLEVDGGVSDQHYADCLNIEREAIRADCERYFSEHGLQAALFPSTPAVACPVSALGSTGEQGALSIAYGRNTTPASIAGLPALSLPLGLSQAGLPIGLELDGPVGSDRALLALACAVQQGRQPLLSGRPRL